MSKGIATQTILLMLIGIVVAGVVIYIVYRLVLSPSLSETECRSRMIQQCIMCKNNGWKHNGIDPDLYDTNKCAKGTLSYWSDNKNCDEGWTDADCRMLGIET